MLKTLTADKHDQQLSARITIKTLQQLQQPKSS